ncbi:P-loop containing nucleoside triphosphate hydrolase protein [Aureobasidium subglaciale]|nr:P-loop containing nucleoside triphosphate hydrolase protein [Aureobasidium subglaciale]KAI5228974.1 P-loop containing nucleoside triphosphate hydrolase protein [Aureobasidium subglaciale]KAI5232764.1 P-loop containing nucleoside triphosphate hydrolase protein [Aureobasidium subglaciale]KAI5266125.1 P-loop containing nucleoside triphosphate hydrolase protein [Aureobasidium subglaciale]
MYRPRISPSTTLVRVLIRLFSDRSNRKDGNKTSLFKRALTGKFKISSVRDAEAFLSTTLKQRDSPIVVVEEILASRNGLRCLHDAFDIDDSPEWFDNGLQPVLSWLQYPALESASCGSYLQRTLQAIVGPPGSTFWKTYPSHVKYELVGEKSRQCFAWVLLQLLTNTRIVRPFDMMIARDPLVQTVLAESTSNNTRHLGERIQRVAKSQTTRDGFQPRHDNDFQNFREIRIFPTTEEVASDYTSRLWHAKDVFEEKDAAKRLYMYLQHLFRLYRQDWLEEIREQIRLALGKKSESGRSTTTFQVKLTGISCRDTGRKHGQHPWSLKLECSEPLSELRDLDPEQRKAFIKHDIDFMPDGGLGCVIADGKPVAVVKILRDEALLAKSVICVQIPNAELVSPIMLALMNASKLELALLNTAGYAYEPVLGRLQHTTEVPFENELLFWDTDKKVKSSQFLGNAGISKIVRHLQEKPEANLQVVMKILTPVKLDASQANSLLASLRQAFSLIQGPPGTGKSFIGALAAKIFHDYAKEDILIVCHTNQALDQFIQDIRKVGVPDSSIVRLGGQERTDPVNHPLLLSSLRVDSTVQRGRDTTSFVKDIERQAFNEAERLDDLYRNLTSLDSLRALLDAIAIKLDPRWSQAFEISLEVDGSTRIVESGQMVDKHYLLRRWLAGEDPGVFPEKAKYADIWNLSLQQRKELSSKWWSKINQNGLNAFMETAQHHDDLLTQARNANGQTTEQIIRSKRIIACTTSGAAKYPQVLNEAPGIIIVEEAGQVLESHIVTALNPTAKQLIMIGDHKQLRPFVNYNLSVEKGDGYDLNRSMFERLVLKGYPHEVLAQQHRMRPEISELIRQLTYPDLIDAPKTANRPDVRGLIGNVIFVDHNEPEDAVSEDAGTVNFKASKRNTFEAEMTFQTVKYLLQQNYDADSIVVLTPYLGQLKKLHEVFGKEVETVLGNIDVANMERNGLIEDASELQTGVGKSVIDGASAQSASSLTTAKVALASLSKLDNDFTDTPTTIDVSTVTNETSTATSRSIGRPKIKISTIDNYQGQESDIVVASLTRSNTSGDIGFLSSPERLNVLLSRARNTLVLIGSSSTFKATSSAKETWTKFFTLLEEGGHLHKGLPVRCENHPRNTALLTAPANFEEKCPNGGCREPCGVVLRCGHECPSVCHHVGDHSTVKCHERIEELCNRGRHVQKFQCCERLEVISKPCDECVAEDEAEEKETQLEEGEKEGEKGS